MSSLSLHSIGCYYLKNTNWCDNYYFNTSYPRFVASVAQTVVSAFIHFTQN